MYFRTYFDKDNTIVKDSYLNLGSDPMTELFYGGTYEKPTYSRYLFHFPIDRLKSLYNNCLLGDLTKVKHKLVLKPTRFKDSCFKNFDTCLATSYNLCLFPINQDWEEGCGNDLDCKYCDGYTDPNFNQSNGASNWFYAKSDELWQTNGVFDTFSGDTVYIQCKSQTCNDCLFEMDMTDVINDLISGSTVNYGYGLAFHNNYEINPDGIHRYIGFYTNETSNFFKPYIETEYINPIIDDRGSFYTDKLNSLYLYVNLKGEPTNLDEDPIVTIYNEFDDVYITLTGECITQGIYGVNLMVLSSGTTNDCVAWRDVWSNIRINGVLRPNVEMEFQLKPDTDYYQIGFGTSSPKTYGFKYSGIKRNETIRRGDIRKIVIDTYEAFNIQKRVIIDNLYYRLYVKEGLEQIDVIPWTPVNIGACENFIYLYTEWMLPQYYYLDFKAVSNQEERTYPEEIKFVILDDDVKC